MRSLIGVVALSLSLTTVGSLARQAFDLRSSGPAVGWTCPGCGAANAGHPAVDHAACTTCRTRFGWAEVVRRDRLGVLDANTGLAAAD